MSSFQWHKKQHQLICVIERKEFELALEKLTPLPTNRRLLARIQEKMPVWRV
jgi:hypothetical protein